MTGSRSCLETVEGFEGLWAARRGNLSCVSVSLQSGGICLYSPVEKLSAEFVGKNPVHFLLAPNHYHNKAIGEYSSTFGKAQLVCSKAARSRLEKVTSKKFSGLEALGDELPNEVTLIEPEGLKTGEVWLRVQNGTRVAWIVTDAFCGLKKTDDERPKIGFLKTFPKYGVQDPGLFTNWIRNRLELETPDLILPCHGEQVRGPALKSDIQSLMDTL
ncbi:hypothetical protein LP7551_05308 [Roseibium album]|nr:hypothetical protein LP7551_05308 [Roseibium album]